MKKISPLLLLFFICQSYAQLVQYNFDIDVLPVNFTGNQVHALTVNKQVPAPTIEATVGDTLRVTFNNKMDVDSSIHWHGVLLPNDQDGVPYLTTQPIAAHSSFTYEYPITHSGTYWYHSHTGFQEQRGIYGPIVFHPKNAERQKTDQDHVVVFSDWTDESPHQVMANLKKDGDYYALKKDSVQSWDKVIANGIPAIKNRLNGSLTRMGPMDISDVGYDAFLANGKKESVINAKKGEKIRLRLINAGASSYFYVQYAGGPMTIVAADGIDVEPVKVNKLRMAIAETFDVIVDVKDKKSYELRNTSEDGTGFASVFVGSGEKVYAPTIPKPNLFLADHSMHDMHMEHGKMGHNMPKGEHHHMHHSAPMPEVVDTMDNYQGLKAAFDTRLPENRKLRIVNLELTGNMERYVWSFNNKTLSEADNILIKKGENTRFVLTNATMMHHPVHLHGHFFRVVNEQGDKSPLKHTVNVPPMGKVIIEFAATEEKDWFFHCHNLYHMMSGMARVISYEKTTQADESVLRKLWHDKDWFMATDVAAYDNLTTGTLRTSNSRHAIELEYEHNYKKDYEFELIAERSINRFLDFYTGGEFEREAEEGREKKAIFGSHYVLPMLIESNLRFDNKGKVRLGLSSDLQLTARTKFEWDWNTDDQYMLKINYELGKKFLLSANYDSDNHAGLGIRLKI